MEDVISVPVWTCVHSQSVHFQLPLTRLIFSPTTTTATTTTTLLNRLVDVDGQLIAAQPLNFLISLAV